MAKHDDEFTYDVGNDGASAPEATAGVRSKVITVAVTGALVLAGLAGGAAFAISRIPHDVASGSSAISKHPKPNSGEGTQTPSPAVSATMDAAKTIVVPPAPFVDKGGARKFHEQPAGGAAQASTSAPAAPSSSAPPTFGNGGDKGGDHNGDFNGDPNHHKDINGVKPPHAGHDDGGFSLPSPTTTN
jgi:hypothetical protein